MFELLFWRKKPDGFVKEVLNYVHSGKILEIGCGEGANSIFLIRKGFENLTAINTDNSNTTQFESLVQKKKFPIQIQKAEIGHLNIFGSYDLIICNFPPLILEKYDYDSTIKSVKSSTFVGGINAVVAYIDTDDSTNLLDGDSSGHLFKTNEMHNYYVDDSSWKVIDYYEVQLAENKKVGVLITKKIN